MATCSGVVVAQSESVCYVKKVEEIDQKSGRCHHCLKMKQQPHHTSFGGSMCNETLQNNLF